MNTLTAEQARRLIEEGAIDAGMIPKVEACLRALSSGIKSYIVDGRKQDTLLGVVRGDSHKLEGTVFSPSVS